MGQRVKAHTPCLIGRREGTICVRWLVGMARLELATPRPQSVCATKLRYIPMNCGSWNRTNDMWVKATCLNHLAIPHQRQRQDSNLRALRPHVFKTSVINHSTTLAQYYRGELNPRYRRERAVSLPLDHGSLFSRFGLYATRVTAFSVELTLNASRTVPWVISWRAQPMGNLTRIAQNHLCISFGLRLLSALLR